MKKRSVKLVLITAASVLAAAHGVNLITKAVNASGIKKRLKKDGEDETIKHYTHEYGKVRYRTAGQSGRPLILLHTLDNSCGMDEWDNCFNLLSRRYRVYALEFPGFGFSEKPDQEYSAYLLVSVLRGFLRDVVGSRAYVAASGGSAGVALAAAQLMPAYFRKIILISPSSGLGQTPRVGLTAKIALRLPIVGTFLYNFTKGRTFSAHYNESVSKKVYQAGISGKFNVNLPHMIKIAKIPIHIIWGGRDKMNPASNFNKITKSKPSGVTLTVLDNTDGYPHYNSTGDVVKLFAWFFRG